MRRKQNKKIKDNTYHMTIKITKCNQQCKTGKNEVQNTQKSINMNSYQYQTSFQRPIQGKQFQGL